MWNVCCGTFEVQMRSNPPDPHPLLPYPFQFTSYAQSPYANYASQQQQQQSSSGGFSAYPASFGQAAAASGGQYIGYATTVQPQLVQYTQQQNGQNFLQQQQQQQQFLGRIPHNQPVADYSYHNPNIIHAHNQNLFSSSNQQFPKVNPKQNRHSGHSS